MHIPLQSGSDKILRTMRRRYRVRHYLDRVARARALMPQASIGADVIVGFPGETDRDFEQTCSLVASAPLTYLHVFTYSAREGTAAAELPGQVPKALKKERNRILRELAANKNRCFRKSLAGWRTSAVTLDRTVENGTAALTDNFLEVTVDGPRLEPARLIDIELTGGGASLISGHRVGLPPRRQNYNRDDGDARSIAE
jgi:threonylcarbamoyladenosine tRNA methylthiotransferase MtaB